MKKILICVALSAVCCSVLSQSLENVVRKTAEPTANNFTVTIPGYGSSYNDKEVHVAFTTPASGPATLNITPSGGSALGVKPLRIKDGADWRPIAAGDITGDSSMFILHYSTACGCLRIHPQGTGSGGGGGSVNSVLGTTNRITSTGGTDPVIDISATFEALLGKVANRIDQNNASTTSAQLASVLSDEEGSSGGFVRANGNITGNAATVTTNANLTGDVTSTGNATTIATNAVTFGKIQAITDNRLLGAQGGTAVEEISVSSPLTLSSNAVGIQTASGSQAGAISSADWLAHSRKANQRFNYINAQTGTSYTALAADSITRTLVTMDNASANNFIIPTNTTLPYRIGTELYVSQIGDGTTSIIGADGTVTLTYQAGVSSAVSKNGLNVARKTGTNTWTVYNGTPPQTTGDLTKTNGIYLTGTITGTPIGALNNNVNISWDLTSAVPPSLGGTGLTSLNAGDIIWGSAANTYAAKNILATTQTAYWHLKAGTATASTAPIKLTTGTVNTTAEAGAIEYTTPQLFFTNGGARRQEIPQIQQSRVSTQFDATSNTTLANVTGLTATVVASRTYRFEAELYTTSNVAGGVKFAIGGTATATNIIYECTVIDANVNAAQTRATALATAVGGVTAVTVAYAKIRGTITVNAAGTITVQFAQNASNGSASSVLVGSTFVLTEML